jgi:hypothetical protein
MGLFDFATDLLGATIKVALTPVALAADVVDTFGGEPADTTKNLLGSALEDVSNLPESLLK